MTCLYLLCLAVERIPSGETAFEISHHASDGKRGKVCSTYTIYMCRHLCVCVWWSTTISQFMYILITVSFSVVRALTVCVCVSAVLLWQCVDLHFPLQTVTMVIAPLSHLPDYGSDSHIDQVKVTVCPHLLLYKGWGLLFVYISFA